MVGAVGGGGGGALQNLMGAPIKLSQYMGGAWGGLKSLQACKFTKNELLHTYFLRILARF